MAVTASSPRASYLPDVRRAAAEEQLQAAILRLAEVERTMAGQANLDKDEQAILREQLQGARAGVKNCKRYIAAGCPRVRETA